MSELGKLFLVFGLVFVAVGLLLTFAGKIPWLGRLPGDLYIERDRFSFYFPLATCLLLSLVLTALLWIFRR
jgi:hypothetical protein